MAQRVAIAMALMPAPGAAGRRADFGPGRHAEARRARAHPPFQRRHRRGPGHNQPHHLRLVGRFCDTLVVMYGGRVIESGPPDSTKAPPAPLHAAHRRTPTSAYRQAAPGQYPRQPRLPSSIRTPVPVRAGCQLAEEACWREEPPLIAISGARVACPVVTRETVREGP